MAKNRFSSNIKAPKKLIKSFTLLIIALLFTVFCCTTDEGATLCIVEHNLETYAAENVTANSARLSGSIGIVSENFEIPLGAQQGFVYATSSMPNIDDNLITVNAGDISASLNGLNPETTYYVRTFIANSIGEYYGNEINFTTTATGTN
jgi:hypothetical protein